MLMLYLVKLLFLLSKVTEIEGYFGVGGGSLYRSAACYNLRLFWEESEASTSFTPFRKTSLSSKNAQAIYQTLLFLVCVYFYTGHTCLSGVANTAAFHQLHSIPA